MALQQLSASGVEAGGGRGLRFRLFRFRVQGFGFRVSGLGFRAWGLGFTGSGFRAFEPRVYSKACFEGLSQVFLGVFGFRLGFWGKILRCMLEARGRVRRNPYSQIKGPHTRNF